MKSFYEIKECIDGTYGFRTPTGRVNGIFTKERAEIIAAAQERQDREEAESDSDSVIAKALRKHFAVT